MGAFRDDVGAFRMNEWGVQDDEGAFRRMTRGPPVQEDDEGASLPAARSDPTLGAFRTTSGAFRMIRVSFRMTVLSLESVAGVSYHPVRVYRYAKD